MKFLSALFASAALATAQTVMPPFHTSLSIDDLGFLGVSSAFSGTAFRYDNANVLLFGEYQTGRIDALPITRDGQGHPIGFGARSPHAVVSGPGGGLAYGPGNVLFYAAFPSNQLGQVRPGSGVENRLIDLAPFGIGTNGPVGACAFVPAGRPGAGRFKVATYVSDLWYDVTLAPDGMGTYSITGVGPAIGLGGSLQGIAYPPATMPMIGNNCVLVCEYYQNVISVFSTDANGNPIPASRQVLVENIYRPVGGAVDPVSGDIVFGSDNGNLYVLSGRGRCGQITPFGAGAPGTNGVPTFSVQGCARIGETLTMQIGNGRPGAFGLFGFGFFPGGGYYANVPILSSFDASLGHFLSAAGTWSWNWQVPVNGAVGLLHLYVQAGYLDPMAPAGVSATSGVDLYLR